MAIGVILGMVLLVMIVICVFAGAALVKTYSQYKAERNAEIASIQLAGTYRCNNLGYESFDMGKNLCYTQHNLNYQLKKTYYVEYQNN